MRQGTRLQHLSVWLAVFAGLVVLMSNVTLNDGTSKNLDDAHFGALTAGDDVFIKLSSQLTINAPPHANRGYLGRFVVESGSKITIDGRSIRQLSFSSGSGTLSYGDTITGGTSGATAEFIGFVSGDATGGVALLRSVSGGPFQGESISATSWSATADGADTVGMLLLLLDEAPSYEDNEIGVDGELEILGEWIELGSGDGSASQTVEHWTGDLGLPDVVAGVWVETGSGTGVYQKYVNIGARPFTDFGNGDLGLVCKMTFGDATITFGDGTNGKVPPSGAKIRVPNVHLCSTTSASAPTPTLNTSLTSRARFKHFLNSTLTIDKGEINMDGGHDGILGAQTISNASFCRSFTHRQDSVLRTYTDCIFSGDGGGGSYQDYYDNNPCRNQSAGATFDDCAILLRGQQQDYLILNGRNFTFTDCWLSTSLNRTNGSVHYFACENGTDVLFDGCKVIGQSLRANNSANVTVLDCLYADRRTNSEDTSAATNAFWFVNVTNGKIDGVGFLLGTTGRPYNQVVYLDSCNGVKVRNIGTEASPLNFGSHTFSMLYLYQIYSGIQINKCYGQNARGDAFEGDSQGSGVVCDSYGLYTSEKFDAPYANAYYRQLRQFSGTLGSSTGVSTSLSTYGTHFLDTRISTTAGRFHILFTPPSSEEPSASSYSVVAGNPTFNGSGRLVFNAVNDQVLYETQKQIVGYDGFANAAPTLAGSGSGFYVEYAINTGSGWSAYKEATGANLSGESIPATGFHLRVRIKLTSGAGTYLNGFYLELTTDNTTWDNNQLPVKDLVDVVLENVVGGSEYRIENLVSGEVLTGTKSGAGDLSVQMSYSGSNESLEIRVRRATSAPKYKPLTTQATLTSSGARVYVAQQPFPAFLG